MPTKRIAEFCTTGVLMSGSGREWRIERQTAVAAVRDGPRRRVRTVLVAHIDVNPAVDLLHRHAFVGMKRTPPCRVAAAPTHHVAP